MSTPQRQPRSRQLANAAAAGSWPTPMCRCQCASRPSHTRRLAPTWWTPPSRATTRVAPPPPEPPASARSHSSQMDEVIAMSKRLRQRALEGPAPPYASGKWGQAFVFRNVRGEVELLLKLPAGSATWAVPQGPLSQPNDTQYDGIIGLRRILRETVDPNLEPHHLAKLNLSAPGGSRLVARAFAVTEALDGSWPPAQAEPAPTESTFTINGRNVVVENGFCWVNAADLLLDCPGNLDSTVHAWCETAPQHAQRQPTNAAPRYGRNADTVLREFDATSLAPLVGHRRDPSDLAALETESSRLQHSALFISIPDSTAEKLAVVFHALDPVMVRSLDSPAAYRH